MNNSCKDQWTHSSEGKPDLVVDQDEQYKITLEIKANADRYKVISNP